MPPEAETVYIVDSAPWKEPDDLLDGGDVEGTFSIPEIGSDDVTDDYPQPRLDYAQDNEEPY